MLTGNRPFLFIFSIIFNIRLLTELPRAMNLMGWISAPENDYNRFVSALLLGFCLVCVLIKRKIIMPNLFGQVILIASFCFLISTGIAIHTFNSNEMPLYGIFVVLLRYVMEIVLAVFIMNFVQNETDLRTVFLFFFGPALFFFILFSLLQIATSSYGNVQGVNRIMGPFGSPTTLAGFLHLFIVLTYYYYDGNHGLRFWSLLVIQYVLLLYTGSIAIILANFIFIFLVSYKQGWIKLKSFYRVFPVIALIAVVTAVVKIESILLRLSIVINLENFELSRGSSLKWRWDAWHSYLSLLGKNLSNWLFGLGVGVQRYILHPDYPNSRWRIFDSPGTHNDYLAMLVDFGLIGLGMFAFGLCILFRVIRNAEKRDTKLYYLRFYFITALFIMLTENFVDQLIMFVFILFLTAIIGSEKLTTISE